MLRKIFTLNLLLVGALLLGACNVTIGGNPIQGRGEMVSHTFQVEDFTAIDIGGNYNVVWRQSQTQTLTIEMQENLFEHLQVSVANGVLLVDSRRTFNTGLGNTPRIYIHTPALDAVSFSGAANATDWDTIRAQNFSIDVSGAANISIALEVEQLDIDVAGAADIELSGSAGTANLISSGAGSISAFSLQTASANIDLSGVGSTDISVSDTLDVDISGAGQVRYRGNPTVTQDVSGLGRVSRAD